MGLRLREATTLQVKDILSDRGLVHIHGGKGYRDRTVPLPPITLSALRDYYKTHRNSKWIFPALGRNGGKDAQYAENHVSQSGVQGVLRSTLKRMKFKKHVHLMYSAMPMQLICSKPISPYGMFKKYWVIKPLKVP